MVRHRIQKLSPYMALMLLAVPTITVELSKVCSGFLFRQWTLADRFRRYVVRIRLQPFYNGTAICAGQAKALEIAVVQTELVIFNVRVAKDDIVFPDVVDNS
jgi:hypothetical protein